MRFFLLLLCLPFAMAAQESKLQFTHLQGDFYIYTTRQMFSGISFPSNSMYLVTQEGVVLFDTPWDKTQGQPLLDSIEARHNKKVILCLSTHYHDDRTAGLDFFKEKGIKTYSSKYTYDLCVEHNQEKPAHYFVNDTIFKVGEYVFETFYAGEGHTEDNIVIWFPGHKILYGGCLVKSTESNNLGNIADASLDKWEGTIRKIIKKYPKPSYVVPGHFRWSQGRKPLRHTLKLLRRHEE